MSALLRYIAPREKKSWADELSHYSTCVFFSRGRSEKYQDEEKSSEDDDDTLRSIDIDWYKQKRKEQKEEDNDKKRKDGYRSRRGRFNL